VRLAIADPPYPPLFAERHDTADGLPRLTARSRALRWYGDGTRGHSDPAPADLHPDSGIWDDLTEHRRLLLRLVDEFDGWAIATTPDGLQAYLPLPVSARIMAWHRPNAMPGGGRIASYWEPVIVFTPVGRRARHDGERVKDVLTAGTTGSGFAGSKPPQWTRWVLDALGYDPQTDEVVDLFPGSGAVAAAADGLLI
jgi:hypothetical protein